MIEEGIQSRIAKAEDKENESEAFSLYGIIQKPRLTVSR